MKKIIFGLLLVIITFMIFSCSTNKQLISNDLSDFSVKNLISEVENHYFDYETFQAKLSVDYEGSDSKMSLKGMLRMEKDSIIWVSLSLPMGLEVARVMITEDSIFFLNKAQKKYFKGSYDTLLNVFPFMNLKFAQSVFLGEDFYLNKGDEYSINFENFFYNILIYNRLSKEIKQKNLKINAIRRSVVINSENYKICKYKISDLKDETNNINLDLSDFQKVGEKQLPSKIIIKIDTGYVTNIKIDYSNIIVNEPLEYKFSIPKKYTRMR